MAINLKILETTHLDRETRDYLLLPNRLSKKNHFVDKRNCSVETKNANTNKMNTPAKYVDLIDGCRTTLLFQRELMKVGRPHPKIAETPLYVVLIRKK